MCEQDRSVEDSQENLTESTLDPISQLGDRKEEVNPVFHGFSMGGVYVAPHPCTPKQAADIEEKIERMRNRQS